MKIHHSRRKFLKDISGTMAATSYFFGLENLLGILLQQNLARASDSAYPYKYVNILTPNGPPRWYFDQPLNPTGEASKFNPGGFGTKIVNANGDWKSVYATKPVIFGGKTVQMPPVWDLNSASSGESFASLLDNAVMIRGLNMEIDGHELNQERCVRPFAAGLSISGVVGAASSAPTPSIGFSTARTTRVFKSPDSVVGVAVRKNAPVQDLILPFNVAQIVRKDDLDFSIKQALQSIDRHIAEQGLSSHGADQNLNSTYEIFARNLSAYQVQYKALYDKYQSIVIKEFRAEFPGLTTDLKKIKPNGKEVFSFSATNKFNSGTMSSVLAAMNPPAVAEAFAFVEFALKENLTSSLTVDLGGVPVENPAANGGGISNDQHYVGSVISSLVTSLFYRTALGCLSELRRALTAAGLFDKTVIHFAAEFSRSPRIDASGSDHGFEASSTSIFSGMIKKGSGGLVGNIGMSHADANYAKRYPGTWGHARTISLPDGQKRFIINDDIMATICEMLQVPKIGTKGVSLVKSQNDLVNLLVKGYANVA